METDDDDDDEEDDEDSQGSFVMFNILKFFREIFLKLIKTFYLNI